MKLEKIICGGVGQNNFAEDKITIIISPQEAEKLMMGFQKLALQAYDYLYDFNLRCDCDEFAEFFWKALQTWQECRNNKERGNK